MLEISNKESLKKENITLDNSINEFNKVTQKILIVKDNIENEINKINNLYEKVNDDLTKSFQKKHEILLKREEILREELQNEVTKAKENLENYLDKFNSEIKLNEKIIKGIQKIVNKEKNTLKDLAYISALNKTMKEIENLLKNQMKTIKFNYIKEQNNIIYEKCIFDGLSILKYSDNNKDKDDLYLNLEIQNKSKKFIERKFNNDLKGELDDEGFFITPNGSFWDPDGVYFNKKGYDKHGGHYDLIYEYIPGEGWVEEHNCYEDELEDELDDYEENEE